MIIGGLKINKLLLILILKVSNSLTQKQWSLCIYKKEIWFINTKPVNQNFNINDFFVIIITCETIYCRFLHANKLQKGKIARLHCSGESVVCILTHMSQISEKKC